ncbi:hypothetical protein PN823_004454 [Enterobacter hormaechei]|nr:hypothetical protein [Enterobacter hormaechei]
MIQHIYTLVRAYSCGMVLIGLLSAIIDHVLFTLGHITRRVSLRGCFVMGLLWPLVCLLLTSVLWSLRKKR